MLHIFCNYVKLYFNCEQVHHGFIVNIFVSLIVVVYSYVVCRLIFFPINIIINAVGELVMRNTIVWKPNKFGIIICYFHIYTDCQYYPETACMILCRCWVEMFKINFSFCNLQKCTDKKTISNRRDSSSYYIKIDNLQKLYVYLWNI